MAKRAAGKLWQAADGGRMTSDQINDSGGVQKTAPYNLLLFEVIDLSRKHALVYFKISVWQICENSHVKNILIG